MPLKVFHNKASNTHENEQFRRIAKDLIVMFDEMKWNGILIGNPENPDFGRFQPDAILYYENGIIIIDLKDYTGDIHLPPNENEFRTTKWYNDVEKDKRRIEIKGGSYINPFKQLEVYRSNFQELIKSNLVLKSKIDHRRVSIANIFRSPIKLNRETPKSIPYYRITQESNFQEFLYDYSSPTKFYNNTADELLKTFPCEEWKEEVNYKDTSKVQKQTFVSIDGDVESSIKNFLKNQDQQIMILESSNESNRDSWMRYILNIGSDFNIPQTEIWAHSTRIAKRIRNRTDIEPSSLYQTIYGGNTIEPDRNIEGENSEEINNDGNGSDVPDQTQEIVGIRNDQDIDEKCLIVVAEAHLITRSLFQSELLRFGTGRLLEDLITHLNLNESKRKIIFIGDPYSLSYGDVSECALNKETLSDIVDKQIIHFKDSDEKLEGSSLLESKKNIIASIESGYFNNFNYNFIDQTIQKTTKEEAETLFHSWFKNVSGVEPDYCVCVYKTSDTKKINGWIRKHVQKKNQDLVSGDLLIVNNNFNIPDETGLSFPQKISNGMYLQVDSQLDRHTETFPIRGYANPVTLSFIKLRVKCLSITTKTDSDIWILENYFLSNELSKEEQIAFRIFVDRRIENLKKQSDFESSFEFNLLQDSSKYKDLLQKEKEYQKRLSEGEKVQGKFDKTGVQIRKLKREAKNRYHKSLFKQLLSTDPMVNAAFVQYGYCMTVHKALGSKFKSILFNNYQGENRGVTNESYFRWLYTGITCATDSIHAINPVDIHPMMECVFEDCSAVSEDVIHTKRKKTIVFPDSVQIPSELDSIIDNEIPNNLKRGIALISSEIEQQGYIIDKTESHNYLIKVLYTTPDGDETLAKDKLVIAINHNKKGEFSSCRIESIGKGNRKYVESAIESISNKYNKTEANIPEGDFRESLYERWEQSASQKQTRFSIEEQHSNQDLFLVEQGEKKARMRVWYTDEGFISKVIILEKNDEAFSDVIKDIISNEQ